MSLPLTLTNVVITAEHATNHVPAELGRLGLGDAVFASHVAWDPGVFEVASYLAEHLRAPLFMGSYTRLVADLNRSPDSPEVVPSVAFGVPVPGNAGLDEAARRARVEKYHTPYWNAVRAELERRLAETEGPVLHLSVHSFTGELHGNRREVELGLLYDPARALEDQLAEALEPALSARGFDTRKNEPYDGRADALVTANRKIYAAERYAGFELEISHNLLERIDEVAEAIESALVQALG
jgi:predicted N-formylglutamate amidohydrolase